MATIPRHEHLTGRINETAARLGRPVRLMEVCGTHTHAIGRTGLRALMPPNVELVSGPGCPVCVTAQSDIERMLHLARREGVTVCTFGDMLRVPGREASLEQARAAGADVRVVYSPLDALEAARGSPGREVVFLAVGFETTAPGVASLLLRIRDLGVENLAVYVAHKLVVPALDAVLNGAARIDGLLTPGHVSVIIGPEAYAPLALRHGTPCVVTGFEPTDILEAIAQLLEHIERNEAGSFVQYARAVRPGGNRVARETMFRVFETADAEWRGLGWIPGSGLALRSEFAHFDAAARHNVPELPSVEVPGCRCGDVLRGAITPGDCPLFGAVCVPRNPVGPCMVSSEGACAARYRYG